MEQSTTTQRKETVIDVRWLGDRTEAPATVCQRSTVAVDRSPHIGLCTATGILTVRDRVCLFQIHRRQFAMDLKLK